MAKQHKPLINLDFDLEQIKSCLTVIDDLFDADETEAETRPKIRRLINDAKVAADSASEHLRVIRGHAAAPDMLEALQRLLEKYRNCARHAGNDPEVIEASCDFARAAIAKATGERT